MDDLTEKSGQIAGKIAKRTKKLVDKSSLHVKNVFVDRLDNVHRVRGKVIGWIVLMAVLISFTGLQFMWYRASYEVTVFASGGTYAEATLGKVNTLNPLYAVSDSEIVVADLVFSRLYDFDVTGHSKGDLARSIVSDEDEKVFNLVMREGVKWHDGETVTVDDVIFTIDVIKNPSSRSTLYASWKDVAVEKVGEYELEFRLPSSYAAFTDALTFPVLPEHILKSVPAEQMYENDFSLNPIGSGPFAFKAIQSVGKDGEKIVHLASNDRYYRGAPKVDRFLVHAFLTREDIIAAMKSSSVSATAELTVADGEKIGLDKLNLREAGINSGVFVFLNTKGTALKDVRTRQALQYGIDIGKIRGNISGVTPLDLPVLDSQIQLNLLVNAVKYDANKAKSLLKAAGFKTKNGRLVGKDDVQVVLRVATVGEYESIARNLESQLLGLGYGVDLQIYNTGDIDGRDFLQDAVRTRNYDILIYEIEMGSDPDMFAYYHSTQIGASGLNLSNYSSVIADDLLIGARATADTDMRDAKYEAFVKLWLEDVPAIGLYQSGMAYYYNSSVKGFSEDSKLVAPIDRFADVIYWSANKSTYYRTP